MASITSYARLEPQPRNGDPQAAATAPVHDPLWLLARQWQVSEFAGHDGGNPIVARWRGTAAPPTRFLAGPPPRNAMIAVPLFDADAAPLEAVIERVTRPLGSASDGPDGLRFAIDAGRHFLALLAKQRTTRDYRADVVARYALQALADAQAASLDPATAAYARLHTGRSPDGRRLLAELATRDVPRLDSPIDPMDLAEIAQAVSSWREWLETLFHYADAESACWQPERFEYSASVAGRRSAEATSEVTLSARRYDRDSIDWYEFDVNGEVNFGTRPNEAGAAVTRTVVPVPVTAPGLPAPRFWEFEDGRVNIAAIKPVSTDLAQVLLVETLSGHGNDWYVIGVDLPVGRIIASTSLTVIDTFGVKTLLKPAGAPGTGQWGMFRHAMPADDSQPEGVSISNLLYLAPRLAQSLVGPVVEQVTLVRDEQSNLGWAIEQLRESPLQVGVPLSDARPPSPPVDPGGPPQYRLFNRPPPHWIPLLPVREDGSAQVRLARGAVGAEAGGGLPVGSVTTILGGGETEALLIPEEEVPSEGLVVQRHYQAARWIDGRLHVWAAQRTRPAGSIPSANLRFDTVGE